MAAQSFIFQQENKIIEMMTVIAETTKAYRYEVDSATSPTAQINNMPYMENLDCWSTLRLNTITLITHINELLNTMEPGMKYYREKLREEAQEPKAEEPQKVGHSGRISPPPGYIEHVVTYDTKLPGEHDDMYIQPKHPIHVWTKGNTETPQARFESIFWQTFGDSLEYRIVKIEKA